MPRKENSVQHQVREAIKEQVQRMYSSAYNAGYQAAKRKFTKDESAPLPLYPDEE